MTVTAPDALDRTASLEKELTNFRSMMEYVHSTPTDFSLDKIQVHGETFPLNGVLGGDHIIFVDFKRRYNLDRRIEQALERGDASIVSQLVHNKSKLGVLVADACGHDTTDSLLAAMLHQAFLTGVLYELEVHGHVTSKLFEILNTRFHRSSSVTKFLTMIYGEISEDGTFRFISAGHPQPLIFSAEFDRFVRIDPSRLQTFFPVGLFPSEGDPDDELREVKPLRYKKRYTVNEVNLMSIGDILILATDGLSEHGSGGVQYVPEGLEQILRSNKNLPPSDIVGAVREDMLRLAPLRDDLSLVVIKRTG
jgi:serine phosphatase RsbU (regulator of sigma subunit)